MKPKEAETAQQRTGQPLSRCTCAPDNQDECCPDHGRYKTLTEAYEGGREHERAMTLPELAHVVETRDFLEATLRNRDANIRDLQAQLTKQGTDYPRPPCVKCAKPLPAGGMCARCVNGIVQADRVSRPEGLAGQIRWLLQSALDTVAMNAHPSWRAQAQSVLDELPQRSETARQEPRRYRCSCGYECTEGMTREERARVLETSPCPDMPGGIHWPEPVPTGGTE